MWTFLWILPLSIIFHNPSCQGYSSGAPPTACATLTPKHRDFQPQDASPPYRVDAFERDGKVRVSISNSPEFQGFVIQARSKNDRNKIVHGTFAVNEDVSKTVDCLEGKKNTLTHINKEPKRGIDTEWTPAPGVNEEVIFRATVAKTYDTFWTNIDSPPVRVRRGSGNSEKDKLNSGGIDYSSCGVSRGCFGMPLNCIIREDCDALVSYVDGGSGIIFTLEGSLSATGTYIATGLSFDDKMGDDSVTECFLENGMLSAQNSWNVGKSNSPDRKLTNEDYQWTYTNGIGTCSWTRPYVTTVNGKNFDLLNSAYHILLAKGTMGRGGGVGYHTLGRLASAELVNFTAFDFVGGAKVDPAIKIHGDSDTSMHPSTGANTQPETSTQQPSTGSETTSQNTSTDGNSGLRSTARMNILLLLFSVTLLRL